jgi:hypothetical protein
MKFLPSRRRSLAAASAALALVAASPAFALCTSQGLDLMRNLNGLWRGKGAVTPIGGSPEFVTCRIAYAMAGPDVIDQDIACAGTDYKLEATSRVTCNGNLLEGVFEEKASHARGHVSGTISGNYLFVEADSPGFKGNFKVDYATGRQIPVASIKLTR